MILLEEAVKANDIEKVSQLQKRYANLSASGDFNEAGEQDIAVGLSYCDMEG